MTYPKATPHSGSANPTAPPVPKWPKLPGFGPKGRRGTVGLKPRPKVTSSSRTGQYPLRLRRGRLGQQARREEPAGLEEGRVEPGHPGGRRMAVGRRDLGARRHAAVLTHAHGGVARRIEVARASSCSSSPLQADEQSQRLGAALAMPRARRRTAAARRRRAPTNMEVGTAAVTRPVRQACRHTSSPPTRRTTLADQMSVGVGVVGVPRARAPTTARWRASARAMRSQSQRSSLVSGSRMAGTPARWHRACRSVAPLLAARLRTPARPMRPGRRARAVRASTSCKASSATNAFPTE